MATTPLKIKGNWNEIKKNLKKQYPNLSDTDLTYKEGKENELLEHLQKKLGKKKEEIIDIVNKSQTEKAKHRIEKAWEED